MLKILVISNLYPPDVLGGYEVGCRSMVDELRRRGHDVTVLTSQPASRVVLEDEPHILRRLLLWGVSPNSWRGNALASAVDYQGRACDLFNLSVIIETLHRGEFEVVYCFGLMGLGGLAIADFFHSCGVPWVWHLMDCVPAQLCSKISPEQGAVFRCYSERRFRPTKSFVMSHQLQGEINKRGIEFDRETSVIVPGWAPEPCQTMNPAEWVGGDSKLKVMVAGNLCPEKGTDLILETIIQLQPDERSRLTIDFFGRGDSESYGRHARRLGVDNVVEFHGAVPHNELLRTMAGYHVLLFPTWEREPFGFVGLEAASLGVLPIITKGTGVSEVLEHEVHAIHVERNVASVLAALKQVLSKPQASRAIAEAARRHVQTYYTLPVIADMVERELTAMRSRVRLDATEAQRAFQVGRFKDQLARQFAVGRPNSEEEIVKPNDIQESYRTLKTAGRNASKGFVYRTLRSALMRLLQPVFLVMLSRENNSLARIAIIEQKLKRMEVEGSRDQTN